MGLFTRERGVEQMENTNNSSTYDEMTENKTENQTEGFLYSSEQAETAIGNAIHCHG